jgi:hypothetical protein
MRCASSSCSVYLLYLYKNTGFTSAKVLALLVQKYSPVMCSACAARGTDSRRNAQFTCFTSTKSTNISTKVLSCHVLRPTAQAALAHFTCFTSTKVLALLVQTYSPAMCSALCARRDITRCPGILNIDAHAQSVIDMS